MTKKRFTDAEKWSDPWFRGLPAEFKLGWLYLLDNCDTAGVIDIDKPLADFQIGNALDWDEFRKRCDSRVVDLENGKWFLARFVEFQYGKLSCDCRAHNPVFQSLERNDIDLERVSKGYPKGIDRVSRVSQRVQNKDKDKDRDKDKEKDKDKPIDDWDFPAGWDSPELREALEGWAAMRRRERKPVRSKRSTSKGFKHFDDAAHLLYAAEFCEANAYQGLKPDYRPKGVTSPHRGSQTFAERKLANTQQAIAEWSPPEGFDE